MVRNYNNYPVANPLITLILEVYFQINHVNNVEMLNGAPLIWLLHPCTYTVQVLRHVEDDVASSNQLAPVYTHHLKDSELGRVRTLI